MMKPSSVPCNVRWIAQVHMDFSESAMERAARPTWSHSKVLESNTGQQCPKGQINEMWLSFMTKKRPINSLLGSRVFTKKSVLLKFYQREKTTPKLLPKVHFFFFFLTIKAHTVESFSEGIFRSFVGCQGQTLHTGLWICQQNLAMPAAIVARPIGFVLWSWFLGAENWSFIEGRNNLSGLSFNTMKWWNRAILNQLRSDSDSPKSMETEEG